MKRNLLVVLAIVGFTGGCNAHKDYLPFLGKWKGKFVVSSIGGAGSSRDMERESLRGYIQVYATKQSYKMELDGEQETIQIDGQWSLKGNRIFLKPKSMIIDDKGGSEKRDPNRKYIPADEVRAAYSPPLILVESKDKKRLVGLEMTVGQLVGTHRFEKDSF